MLLRHGALQPPTAWPHTSTVDTLAATVMPWRSMAWHSFWLAGVSMASNTALTPAAFMLTTSVSKDGAAGFSPALGDHGVTEADLPGLVDAALGHSRSTNGPVRLDPADVLSLLHKRLAG